MEAPLKHAPAKCHCNTQYTHSVHPAALSPEDAEEPIYYTLSIRILLSPPYHKPYPLINYPRYDPVVAGGPCGSGLTPYAPPILLF